MALAAPVLEQTYRYPFASAVVGEGERRRLRLATSGGPAANPRFFRGRLLLPVVAADLLLTLGDVARSRFHVPAAMLTRILELADPVATCADERLRFEAFSACCSVYGRVDLLPEAYDGETIGRGTTNVDFGPGIRSALAGVQERSRLGLSVGASAVEVEADGAIGRRAAGPAAVALAARVPRGPGHPAGAGAGRRARRLRRACLLPVDPQDAHRSGRSGWLRQAAACGSSTTIRADGAVGLAGLARLRLFERVARHATSLRVFAAAGDGSTGWQLDVPGARLTLVLSPDVWRGFSGEGRALHRLADAARTGEHRRGPRRARLGAAAGRRRARGHDRPVDRRGRRRVGGPGAVSGIVGYDLAEGGFFRRELPFDLGRTERLQPRLRDARRLVERAAVRIDAADESELAAWVAGAGGVEYRVRSTPTAGAAPVRGTAAIAATAGPCKHVLAVQVVAADDAG